MSLASKYAREIKAWDWAGIVADAKSNTETDYEGNTVGMSFLGTVFGLMPSGKYYTPYACSNVEDCPTCKGKGTVRNRRGNAEEYELRRGEESNARQMAVETFGFYANNGWPKETIERIDRMNAATEAVKPEHTCPTCNGVGSLEAYRDQVYQEELDRIAESHGGYITEGEGDPCDLFFAITVEEGDGE